MKRRRSGAGVRRSGSGRGRKSLSLSTTASSSSRPAAFDLSRSGARRTAKAVRAAELEDEEISSLDSEEDDEAGFGGASEDDSADSDGSEGEDGEEEMKETVHEKRARLARGYVDALVAEQEDEEGDDADEDEEAGAFDTVAARLRAEREEQRGELKRDIAEQWLRRTRRERSVAAAAGEPEEEEEDEEESDNDEQQEVDAEEEVTADRAGVEVVGTHDLPITCMALSDDRCVAVSGSKDNSLVVWDVERKTKRIMLQPTWRQRQHALQQQSLREERRKEWQQALQARRRRNRRGKHGADGGMRDPREKQAARLQRERQLRQEEEQHHDSTFCNEVLAVAMSSDGRYVASGGRQREIRIWDLRASSQKPAKVKEFGHHRDGITALTFRKDTLTLLTGSLDRSVKQFDLREMAYIDTNFGHQAEIMGMDCWRKERAVTCSVDRTLRLWKFADDTHLVFNHHQASIDCVSMLSDDAFVSGSQDGSIALWSASKRKPLATAVHNPAAAQLRVDNRPWITSLATQPLSDMLLSGSNDGFLRVWRASAQDRSLQRVARIAVGGFINAAVLASDYSFALAGTGQEHRLGRWWRMRAPEARNKLYIVPLRTADLT